MLFSAFVNNTAVSPPRRHAAQNLSRGQPDTAAHFLCRILGTLTLIGTSTNLIVSSFLGCDGRGHRVFAFLGGATGSDGLVAMLLMHKVPPRSDQGDCPMNFLSRWSWATTPG